MGCPQFKPKKSAVKETKSGYSYSPSKIAIAVASVTAAMGSVLFKAAKIIGKVILLAVESKKEKSTSYQPRGTYGCGYAGPGFYDKNGSYLGK